MKNVILILLTILLIACGNNSGAENNLPSPSGSSAKKAKRINFSRIINDSVQKIYEQKITTKTNIKKHRKIFSRISELAATDAKLNGEALLIQLDLSPEALQINPEMLKEEVRVSYKASERFFPVSISDNFEQGISTEHISYPDLKYTVQLFKDAYAEKPYKTINYRARHDDSGTTIVE